MRKWHLLVVALGVMSGVVTIPAGEPGESGSLENLRWLAGRWIGDGLGGQCEEVWSPPSGGVMIGTFKLIVDSQAAMYEIMMIALEEGRPVLRLKHFNRDLTGWESKDEFVTFPFVAMGDGEIEFDGLKYKRAGDDLTITVLLGGSDGEDHTEIITCRRSSL